jgi:hypothetical protein
MNFASFLKPSQVSFSFLSVSCFSLADWSRMVDSQHAEEESEEDDVAPRRRNGGGREKRDVAKEKKKLREDIIKAAGGPLVEA